MVQSVLTNLGILLLMHLMINTVYHFQQYRKFSNRFVSLLHILIVTVATITMFHYPINMGNHLFDLRLIPIIFIAFFHGWKFTLPVVVLASIYRYFLGGDGSGHEIMFGMIIPSILPMVFYPLKIDKLPIHKPFIVITICWLISDLTPMLLSDNAIYIFIEIVLFHYLSLILAGSIMNFFIFFSLKHLEMVNKLQFFADHDPLTGLYNMRRFDEIINQISNKKHQNKMFIAMIDIDRFKRINDTYGHQAGDIAIQNVSKIFLKYCSNHLLAARYGGDEFIIFLLEDSIKAAETTLNSIRKDVANNSAIPLVSKQLCKLSISIGISEYKDLKNLNKTIEQADKQLYLAKQAGRNCICG
jgi:diguanylate cyclase